MNQELKDKIEWLYACCLAGVFVVVVVAIVLGFIVAKLMGLQVNGELFNATMSSIIFLILGRMTQGNKPEKKDSTNS